MSTRCTCVFASLWLQVCPMLLMSWWYNAIGRSTEYKNQHAVLWVRSLTVRETVTRQARLPLSRCVGYSTPRSDNETRLTLGSERPTRIINSRYSFILREVVILIVYERMGTDVYLFGTDCPSIVSQLGSIVPVSPVGHRILEIVGAGIFVCVSLSSPHL